MATRKQGSLSTEAIKRSWSVEPRRNSQVQCAECGSSEVIGVCHHCLRPLCSSHVARPAFYQQGSWEFRTLLDSPLWSRAVHCERHAHFVFAYRRIIVIPSMLVLCIMFPALLSAISSLMKLVRALRDPLGHLVWMTWAVDTWNRGQRGAVISEILVHVAPMLLALAGVILSTALAVIGERLYRRRGVPELEGADRPLSDIPYVPEYYKAEVEEMVQVTFQARGGCHVCDGMAGSGHVRLQALRNGELGEIRAGYIRRAQKYQWQLQRTPESHLGYAALDLPPGASWSPIARGSDPVGNLFTLRVRDVRAFSADDRRWAALTFDEHYTLAQEVLYPGEGVDQRPFLRVLPVLKPLSAGRTVLLLFDLAPSLVKGNWVLKKLTVNALAGAFLESDASMPVEYTNGFIDESLMQVRWTRWPLTGSRSAPPSITFSQPVPSLRRPLGIDFEIEGDCAISDFEFGANRIWLPTGAAVDPLQLIKRHTTRVCGKTYIDPALLSYQCEMATEPITELVPEVALTPTVISRLLARLAAADVMIHAVTENSDTLSTLEGQRVFSWDIWGRKYEHVYPLDVHILLSGCPPQNGSQASVSFTVTGRVLMNSQFKKLEENVHRFAREVAGFVREGLVNAS